MSAAREALLAERARLVARAADERDELERELAPWESRLRLADRGLSLARKLRHFARPLAVAAGVGMAALAVTRPASIVGWVGTGQMVWNLITGVRRWRGLNS